MPESDNTLSIFHPLITRWFTGNIGKPTAIQQAAWPKIAAGEHILATAPTGSGKTLAAFLWSLDQLIRQAWEPGETRILYISPLKALNNDIYRNLLRPLKEIREIFEKEGAPFPDIHVMTRSGDTPQSERRQMLRRPPDILITTPESLNILLSSGGGRSVLTGLKTVILDEIHAVVNTKRGTHLITGVDRLIPLSGEFQRIALSATVKPMETIAAFVGGYRFEKSGNYTPRPVTLIESPDKKHYDIRIRYPEAPPDPEFDEDFWHPLVEDFKSIIHHNQSTLLFVKGRRMAEKITLKINSGAELPVAYAHHGSLSKEIRLDVEQKLKEGKLKAIVATSSLELGIDIGALDEVVLIQAPNSIASAIQRVGRAGHQVGETSRAHIYPTFDQDFVQSAVLASAILEQDIESVRPIEGALDVLAQILVSMIGAETRDIDALYGRIRTSFPYHHLKRDLFDLVLNMLAGKYADSRIRDLKPRISIDRLENTVTIRKGAMLALYLSGGMIPDRGHYNLRHNETSSLIGDLDEEFVWEAKIGQTFTLGTQNWKIRRITHNDVFVETADPKVPAAPFWRAEAFDRDAHFSRKMAGFLEMADQRLGDPDFSGLLAADYKMEEEAANQLIDYLKRQKKETGCSLPHGAHIVVEHVRSGPGGVPGNQLIIHTIWGGCVNRPFGMALVAAWEEQYGEKLELFAGNEAVILQLPHSASADDLLSLITPSNVEEYLRKSLEASGFFGARFRECAGRALLLTRQRINRRLPLWMIRLRSQKLMQAVSRYPDFPILLEAWRSCLQDHFDMDALKRVLTDLENGSIRITEVHTSHPSPMARDLSYAQTNTYMYIGDEAPGGQPSRLRSDLLSEAVFTPGLRPTVPPEIVARFVEKRQRLAPGYTPGSALDLIEWVKERIMIPAAEWTELTAAVKRDDPDYGEWIGRAEGKLAVLHPAGGKQSVIAAKEDVHDLAHTLYAGKASIKRFDDSEIKLKKDSRATAEREAAFVSRIEEFLRFYGPQGPECVPWLLGVKKESFEQAISELIDSRLLITGRLVTDGPENDICDAENFEILLRMARAAQSPAFEPLPLDTLPFYMAGFQGLIKPAEGEEDFADHLERLLCFPAPASLWEKEFLPARSTHYHTAWLDHMMQEGNLRWMGIAKKRLLFYYASESAVLGTGNGKKSESPASELFPDPMGRYDFSTLLQISGLNTNELSDRIWQGVWKSAITNDTFGAMRKGLVQRFQPPSALSKSQSAAGRQSYRSRFRRWKEAIPYTGNWFSIPASQDDDDILALEERKKDRVRMLFDRYPVIFRELLNHELNAFQWRSLFRSLRLMELSGEIVSGYFFKDIPGPQFASHFGLRHLQRLVDENTVYWLNAADPASCCGLGLEGFRGRLPARVESTHLVYCGSKLVLESHKRGKELLINVPADDPRIHEILGFFSHLLNRSFDPLKRILIETINEDPAGRSAFADVLKTLYDAVVEFNRISLYRRIE